MPVASRTHNKMSIAITNVYIIIDNPWLRGPHGAFHHSPRDCRPAQFAYQSR